MHPFRCDLHNELHARPSLYFAEPANIYHATIIGGSEKLTSLLLDFGIQKQLPAENFPCQDIFHTRGRLAKWERHTEFLTITIVIPSHTQAEIWPEMPSDIHEIINRHSEHIIELTQIKVVAKNHWETNPHFYGFEDPAVSYIGAGDGVVLSDFRLTQNGVNRILLVNSGLNSFRLGRMARRLLEIETYRMVASLSLPMSRRLSPRLSNFEDRLSMLSESNSKSIQKNTRQLFEDITALSSDIAHETTKIRNRLSATEAYAQIVQDRIAELRESHFDGRQRFGVMIERRFKPTVRYCSSTHHRLEQLSNSVDHLTGLLQTRVHVELEEQNSSILKSLNARATTQIKIQKAVEGLSLIAISYYIISLLKMLYEGAYNFGIVVSERDATLYSAPIAILTMCIITYHILKMRSD